MKKLFYIVFFLFIGLNLLQAQNFPVSVNTTVKPPYSTYLADYVAPGSDKVQLNLILNDFNRSDLSVRLRLRIEGQGFTIETNPNFNPQPILLQGSVPLQLFASDLSSYFQLENLTFRGINRRQVEQDGQLPQGFYRICFEVLEYNRSVKISNSGCAMAWLILNDPPIINLPQQNEKVRTQQPQYVNFQWTPRHTGSPNSAFNVEYEFRLVELWPENRNPNDAILTSPPIYETTTQSTTLIYGPAQTPLELGRKYAFAVRAKSTGMNEQLDLFKNNGWSQVHSFQYGDACVFPGNITAKSSAAGSFMVSFQPDPNNSAYRLRYREADNANADWQEVNSYFDEISINGLKPETAYEYQLAGNCGPFSSTFSETKRITTLEAPEVNYVCGLPPEQYEFENTNPLPELRTGDIINAGDFDVEILEASGSNGQFTGKGSVVVPYLDNLAVTVEFNGIRINSDYRLTAGAMNVKGFGVDVVPDDVSNFLDQLDQQIVSIQNSLGELENTLEISQEVLQKVERLANEIADNGPFTAVEEREYQNYGAPKDYMEEAKRIAAEAMEDASVEGFENISNNVDIARKVAQSIALVNRAKKLNDIHQASDTTSLIAVEFLPSSTNAYGYDLSQAAAHKLNYELLVDESGQTVRVPWVSVRAGQAVQLKANYRSNTTVAAEAIEFKLDDVVLSHSLNGQQFTIELPTTLEDETTYELKAFAGEQIVGKLAVVAYAPEQRQVHLVRVNSAGSARMDLAALSDQLNRIYKPAQAEWTVNEAITELQLSNFDGTLVDDEQATLSTYSPAMREIIKAYKDENQVGDKEDFYLFLVDNSSTAKAGYMPRSRQFGFIYLNESSDIKHTIAHELGHGGFALQHPYEEYPTISQGSTENLMDMAGGEQLRKYQWDAIQNPPVVVGLLEDMQEGAMSGKHKFISFNELDFTSPNAVQNLAGYLTYLTPSGHPFTLPFEAEPSFTGTTSVEELNSLVAEGVLLAFRINKEVYGSSYTYNEAEGSYSFKGYKQISSSDEKFYSDKISARLSNEYNVVIGKYRDGACSVNIGIVSNSVENVNFDGEIKHSLASRRYIESLSVDYSKAGTAFITNCIPDYLSDKSISYDDFQNRQAGLFNPYGEGGLLQMVKTSSGETVYIYSRFDDLSNYEYLEYNGNNWVRWIPPNPDCLSCFFKEAFTPQFLFGLYDELIREHPREMLEAAGVTPIIGEAFDVINGTWYLLEGEWSDAIITYSAAVPFAGWISTGSKIALKPIKKAEKVSGVVKFKKVTDPKLDAIVERVNSLGLSDEAANLLSKELKNNQKLYEAFRENPKLVDAWKAVGKHADLRTNTKFLENISSYSDDLLKQLDDDLLNPKWADELKTLFKESPDDVTNVWKQLKDDPSYAWEVSKTGNARWQKWSQREFFKDVTVLGKKFEAETVLKAFKNRSSQWYGSLKSKVSADFGKNLDDYDMFSQVQLKYDGDNYFVADQVFVKYKTNALGQKTVDDIIVIENKLKSSTQLTTPQSRALSKSNYTVRNAVDKVSEFGSSNTLKQNNALNFNGEIKWYKVYDSENGDMITGIDKL